MAIELSDDTAITSPMPAGSFVWGKRTGDSVPTAFSRESILSYLTSALAAVASSGSASDLSSGTVPNGRLHQYLADISSINDPAVGSVVYFNGGSFVAYPLDVLYSTDPDLAPDGVLGGVTVASRATIEGLSFSASVAVIRTAGYASPGDGGHGVYARIDDPGSTNRRYVQSVDGSWWGLMTSEGANAKQFGARVDDSAVSGDMDEETEALQQMLDSGITSLLVPAGTCRINDGLTLTVPGVTVKGAGRGATTIHGQGHTSDHILVQADDCTVEDIELSAQQYASYGTYSGHPNALLKFQNEDITAEIVNCTVRNVRTVGGTQAVWFTNGRKVDIAGLEIVNPYNFGLALTEGTRHVTATGLDIDGVGIGEGIRLGSPNEDFPCMDIAISNFNMRSCGILNPTRSSWQNTIGSHSNCLRGIVISNGTIADSGPAFEFKFNGDTSPPSGYDLQYQDVLVRGVHVRSGWADKGNATFRWNGAASVGDDMVGRVRFVGCSFIHTGEETPSSTTCSAIALSGADGNEVIGCQIKGHYLGIEVSGSGDTGLTTGARRTVIRGNTIDVLNTGVRMINETFTDLDISSNTIRSGSEGISCSTNEGLTGLRIANNDVVSTATASSTANAIDLRGIISAVIENNHLEADQRAISIAAQPADPSVAGIVRNNKFKLRNASGVNYGLFINEGTWQFEFNRIESASTNCRGGVISAGGTLNAFRNLRGTSATAPSGVGGSLGDYYGNHTLTAGGVLEWHVTTASNTAATWKAAAAVAA